MKKTLIIILIVLFKLNSADAQVEKQEIRKDPTQTSKQPALKTVQTKTTPAGTTPPPPPPPPPPAQTNNAPVYSLTSARVYIRTGSDNKEFPSEIEIGIWLKAHQGWNYNNDCLSNLQHFKNEMAVNSTTNLGLEKRAGNSDKFLLSNIQKDGIELRVSYGVNFFADAWKIENITLVLEFRDQNGNLHPSLGTKTISFSDAIGFLNAEYTFIKCTTDQYFNPLTASIGKN